MPGRSSTPSSATRSLEPLPRRAFRCNLHILLQQRILATQATTIPMSRRIPTRMPTLPHPRIRELGVAHSQCMSRQRLPSLGMLLLQAVPHPLEQTQHPNHLHRSRNHLEWPLPRQCPTRRQFPSSCRFPTYQRSPNLASTPLQRPRFRRVRPAQHVS